MIVETLEEETPRRFALVYETGDEVLEPLADVADERHLGAAHFTAIGGFRQARVAWFDPDENEYRPIEIGEQVEVVSLTGNVVRSPEGGREVHAHVALGRRGGGAAAGHLLSARVRPTLELFLTETGGQLQREVDDTTGLTLIR